MIVYFFKKSKTQLYVWGIGVMVTIGLLYMGYVWTNILKHQNVTLQIVRKGQVSAANFEVKKSDDQITRKEGDFAFVASSRGKYYYPINCSRAQALSAKNTLYFKDKMSAEQGGFIEYTGC